MENTSKKAQSLVEYALLLALIAVISVTILGRLKSSIDKIGNDGKQPKVENSANDAVIEYCKSVGKAYDDVSMQCK